MSKRKMPLHKVIPDDSRCVNCEEVEELNGAGVCEGCWDDSDEDEEGAWEDN